jgi:PAS domain S-box-containing protein
VWAIDGDLRVTYVNPTVERILGYTREELLGRYSLDFLYPDDIEPTLAWLRDAASSATGWPTIVDRWLGKDGSWRYIDTGGVPIVDDQGTVTGFRGVGRDVTDRYLAEQACRRSEERFRLLYQDNPSMYFTLSEDLSVLSVNRHGAEQLGYEAGELVGGSVLAVVHPDDQTHVRRQLESLVKNRGAKHGLEFRKIRKDGSMMWVKESVSVTQDANGERIILVVCEDISERKQMEEALQGLREELERKAQRAVEGQNPYGLTFRELTVLHLVTGGRSDKEIGVVLGIRSQTVSKHVANVLKKMKASSRTQAGVRALREGLIS